MPITPTTHATEQSAKQSAKQSKSRRPAKNKPRTQTSIAADPTTAPDQLKKFSYSGNRSIYCALASNSSATIDAIGRLPAYCAPLVQQNPSIIDALTRNPTLGALIYPRLWEGLIVKAEIGSIPSVFFTAALHARYLRRWLLNHVLKRIDAPKDILLHLASDASLFIRKKAFSRKDLPIDDLLPFANLPELADILRRRIQQEITDPQEKQDKLSSLQNTLFDTQKYKTIYEEAADPTLDPARLRSLLSTSNARLHHIISRNPNLPLDALPLLLPFTHPDVVENPAFLLHFLENQNFFDTLPTFIQIAIAKHSTDPNYLSALARSKIFGVPAAVAENPHAPASALQFLLSHDQRDVRWMAAQNPAAQRYADAGQLPLLTVLQTYLPTSIDHTPNIMPMEPELTCTDDEWRILLQTGPLVQAALAAHPGVPRWFIDEAFARISGARDFSSLSYYESVVYYRLATNPQLKRDPKNDEVGQILDLLPTNHWQERTTILLKRTDTPIAILRQIASEHHHRTRVAAHPHVPSDVFIELLCSADPAVRQVASSNMAVLEKDSHLSHIANTLRRLAGGQALPSKTLATTLNSSTDALMFAEIDADTFQMLSHLPPWAQFLAVQHPACPSWFLEKSLQKHLDILHAAKWFAHVQAEIPNTDIALAEVIIQLLQKIAAHPNLPVDALAPFFADDCQNPNSIPLLIRVGVIHNPHIQTEQITALYHIQRRERLRLLQLAKDDPKKLSSYHLSKNLQNILSLSKAIVVHPRISLPTLLHAITGKDDSRRHFYILRELVYQHLDTPDVIWEILECLYGDDFSKHAAAASREIKIETERETERETETNRDVVFCWTAQHISLLLQAQNDGRARFAAYPSTPPDVLTQILDAVLQEIHIENTTETPSALRDDVLLVYEALAKNPRTPITTLQHCVQHALAHQAISVLALVAVNPNTPTDLLLELRKLKASAVKRALAKNPRTARISS